MQLTNFPAIMNCIVLYVLFHLILLLFVLDVYSNTKICSKNIPLVQSSAIAMALHTSFHNTIE